MLSQMKNILITGYGPFHHHKINCSWEAVKSLPDKISDYNIIKAEFPVEYSVKDTLKQLVSKYKPLVCIHCGVGKPGKIVLETKAHNDNYDKPDNLGQIPNEGRCFSNGEPAKFTSLILPDEYECSDDAGRYLCEFIFYCSLVYMENKSLFIHLPPVGEPFTQNDLNIKLLHVLSLLLNKQNL
jgi:pyroglutamyl-peptidase